MLAGRRLSSSHKAVQDDTTEVSQDSIAVLNSKAVPIHTSAYTKQVLAPPDVQACGITHF